ncbi:hypothetical protein AN958_09260 [Leucoagaricus sp. SymC.cos]|nr:hypothetical protein AN958_09260 [Leucoagaricus sp. SymC.cos]
MNTTPATSLRPSITEVPRHHTKRTAASPADPDEVNADGTAQRSTTKNKSGSQFDPGSGPWKICFDHANKRIGDHIAAWRDEIGNLLIFASLFSSVVATFTVESYHSVQEDPAETTVLLLKSLLALQLNATHPDPNLTIDLDPQAPISATDKRINIYNFLSLILSLIVVMNGILCLQWLREYGRSPQEIPGSRRDQLGISLMRREGMERWHVFTVLSTLSFILLLSLLLFFAALIELLLEIQPIAAFVSAVFVGFATMFILITTLLPSLRSLWTPDSRYFSFSQCPFKSPQAWMAYQVMKAPYIALLHLGHYLSSLKPNPNWRKVSNECKNQLKKLQLYSWLDYDWLVYTHLNRTGAIGVGGGFYWLGIMCIQDRETSEAFYDCIQDTSVQDYLYSALRDKDHRRADITVEAHIWERNNLSVDNDRPGRSIKGPHARDMIVFQTLESLAAKTERGVPSGALLPERVSLFLKISQTHLYKNLDCPQAITLDWENLVSAAPGAITLPTNNVQKDSQTIDSSGKASPSEFSVPKQLNTSTVPDTVPNTEKSKSDTPDPWKACFDHAHKRIGEEITSWKDEIGNSLIFASLFSAVVATFSIESYHNVKQDPAETTVLLLKSLLALQLNATHPDPTLAIDLNPIVPISAADKRINIYNFLSLILSLTVVVGGILCLQWLREYGRNPHEIPGERHDQLSIFLMRRQGMENWHVFTILSALPLLLLLALFLFFAGLIELLLEVEPDAAFAAAVLIGIAVAFTVLATIAPTLHIAFLAVCTFLWYHRSQRSSNDPGMAQLQNWLDYDWFSYGNIEGDDEGKNFYWLGKMCVQDREIAEVFYEGLQDPIIQSHLFRILEKQSARLVDPARRALKAERYNPSSKLVCEVIAAQTLTMLAAEVDRGYMTSILLKQRVDLFISIIGKHRDKDIDCPNAAHSDWERIFSAGKRRQVLDSIFSMLEDSEVGCNLTHLNAVWRIVQRGRPLELDPPLTPPDVHKWKDALSGWITKSDLDESLKDEAEYTLDCIKELLSRLTSQP